MQLHALPFHCAPLELAKPIYDAHAEAHAARLRFQQRDVSC
jgi:hypothetical protein